MDCITHVFSVRRRRRRRRRRTRLWHIKLIAFDWWWKLRRVAAAVVAVETRPSCIVRVRYPRQRSHRYHHHSAILLLRTCENVIYSTRAYPSSTLLVCYCCWWECIADHWYISSLYSGGVLLLQTTSIAGHLIILIQSLAVDIAAAVAIAIASASASSSSLHDAMMDGCRHIQFQFAVLSYWRHYHHQHLHYYYYYYYMLRALVLWMMTNHVVVTSSEHYCYSSLYTFTVLIVLQ